MGLHVAIYSMLDCLDGRRPVEIHLLTDGSISPADLDLLSKTGRRTGKTFAFRHHTISVDRFRDMPWLSGWMTYARLLLGEVLADVDRVLYLDADLIFTRDVAEMYDHDLGGHVLGAVTRQQVSETNDATFFAGLDRPPDRLYFNAGVLLFDLKRWREEGWQQRCFAFGRTHQASLPTADQTILNYVCDGRFMVLPRRYNVPVNAEREPVSRDILDNAVIHLIGFPKPWDFLGEWFNGQAHLYKPVLRQTAASGFASYKQLRFQTIFRTFRKSNAYLKCGRAHLKRLAGKRSAAVLSGR
jgi:lipopolysaccharide biosynthesis glycosyltransferase